MHRLVVQVTRGLAARKPPLAVRLRHSLLYMSSVTTRSSSVTSSSSTSNAAVAPPSQPTALVVGSSGALGSAVTRYLSRQLGMQVIGADLVEAPADLSGGWELDAFLPLPSTMPITSSPDDSSSSSSSITDNNQAATLTVLSVALYQGVAQVLEEMDSPGLSVIVCAAGGWQGDPPGDGAALTANADATQDVQAAAAVLQTMLDVNLLPALATALTVQHCRAPGDSLVVFMGATAALQATPGMLGYGVSKAATHHVVQTLAAATNATNTAKHHPTTIVGILPTTLDTPSNRRAAGPGADTASWTPPSALCHKLGDWWKRPSLRPHSGALVKVHTSRPGESVFELVR
jgi:dihydropteridine reductase